MRARRRRSSDPDSETDAPVSLAAHGVSWRGDQCAGGFYKVDDGRLCAWMAAPPKRKSILCRYPLPSRWVREHRQWLDVANVVGGEDGDDAGYPACAFDVYARDLCTSVRAAQ
jgi:hypothetical protein